jgi:hypothetical protein
MGFPVSDVSGPIVQLLRAKFEVSRGAEFARVRFTPTYDKLSLISDTGTGGVA